MFKIFNVKGILIVVFSLAIIHFGTALVFSPILASQVIKALNEVVGTKISVESVNVWPLTMTITARDIKIFDPDDQTKRMVLAGRSSARLSVIGLLSKRIIFSHITVSGAQIDLEGEPDGSFNIQKLSRGEKKTEAAEKKSIFDQFKKGEDWFGRIYRMIKSSTSKASVEKKKEEIKANRKVKKDVQILPKGRLVKFTRQGDDYFLQVRTLSLENSVINIVSPESDEISINGASFKLKDLALDPKRGVRFSNMELKGKIDKVGETKGNFKLYYDQTMKGEHLLTEFNLSANDVDLAAVSFIYENSIPVRFEAGSASINSKTSIFDDELNSKNSFVFKGQNVVPKSGASGTIGIVPLPSICEAVNKVDPLELKFGISGTVDQPRFEGFEEALMTVIRPYIESIVQDVKDKGIKALGDMLRKATGGEGE